MFSKFLCFKMQTLRSEHDGGDGAATRLSLGLEYRLQFLKQQFVAPAGYRIPNTGYRVPGTSVDVIQ